MLRIYNNLCPPKTWLWVCEKAGVSPSVPVLFLKQNSDLYQQFKGRVISEIRNPDSPIGETTDPE